MPGKRYNAETKALALEVYRVEGGEAAAAATGVPLRSIHLWAKAAGVTTDVIAKGVEGNEAKRVQLEERKLLLAEQFIDAAVDELARRTASFTETKIVTLSGTPTTPGEWAVASAVREPYAAERKAMVTTAAIAADKAILLTGGATARVAVERLEEREQETVAEVFRILQGGAGEAKSA